MDSLVTVTREAKFDAAHHLPGHVSDCRNVHGHTWLLTLSVTGSVRPLEDSSAERGMVVDMGVLKDWLKRITAELDHRDLNDLLEYPTTERVLMWIAARAKTELEPGLSDGCWVSKVTLSEQVLSPRFWAAVNFPVRSRGDHEANT
jgi:6-pyruvoyltetrahydropterin/6-carboxytetrahydropterin synthase